MAVVQFDFPEDTLESEFLDQSLSMWKGKSSPCYGLDDFKPVPLDLHTACSIGHSNVVRLIIDRFTFNFRCENVPVVCLNFDCLNIGIQVTFYFVETVCMILVEWSFFGR